MTSWDGSYFHRRHSQDFLDELMILDDDISSNRFVMHACSQPATTPPG